MTENGAASRGEHGMLSRDSSPEVERLQIALGRRMSPLEKARAVDGLQRQLRENQRRRSAAPGVAAASRSDSPEERDVERCTVVRTALASVSTVTLRRARVTAV